MAIKRILVPMDFSSDSLHALACAAELASSFGAELRLLHVVEPIYVAEPYLGISPNVGRFLDEQRRIGKEQLERIAADLKKQGHRVRTAVEYGSPAPVIVDTAKSGGASLIVMGTHGRTGLAHMLIGSVAEKVVRRASCPVLTVRGAAKKRKSPSERRPRQRQPGN